jgi:hypothetical protein
MKRLPVDPVTDRTCRRGGPDIEFRRDKMRFDKPRKSI